MLKEEKDETIKYLVDPVYLSPLNGINNPKTIIEDDLLKLKILNEVKRKEYYISEINCYYHKYINYLEIEYTNKFNNKKAWNIHSGKLSKIKFKLKFK